MKVVVAIGQLLIIFGGIALVGGLYVWGTARWSNDVGRRTGENNMGSGQKNKSAYWYDRDKGNKRQ